MGSESPDHTAIESPKPAHVEKPQETAKPQPTSAEVAAKNEAKEQADKAKGLAEVEKGLQVASKKSDGKQGDKVEGGTGKDTINPPKEFGEMNMNEKMSHIGKKIGDFIKSLEKMFAGLSENGKGMLGALFPKLAPFLGIKPKEDKDNPLTKLEKDPTELNQKDADAVQKAVDEYPEDQRGSDEYKDLVEKSERIEVVAKFNEEVEKKYGNKNDVTIDGRRSYYAYINEKAPSEVKDEYLNKLTTDIADSVSVPNIKSGFDKEFDIDDEGDLTKLLAQKMDGFKDGSDSYETVDDISSDFAEKITELAAKTPPKENEGVVAYYIRATLDTKTDTKETPTA